MPLGQGAPQDRPKTQFDVVLRRGPGVVLTPGLGMMTPGYLLAITTEHLTSFGCLGRERLSAVDRWAEEALRELSDVFGPYLVFEHGSSREAPLRSSCVTHAHLHLIPIAEPDPPELHDALPWRPIASLADVADHCDSGYAFLDFAGVRLVSEAPDLPGQWIRRILAARLGVPYEWDWEVFPMEHHLDETMDRLREHGFLV